MSRGRLSPDTRKLPPSACSPTDILFKGIRRKMSHSQYVKTFPSLKLRTRIATKVSACPREDCSEQQMLWEVMKMREENARVEEVNEQLRGRIRKEQKLHCILERRVDGQEVESLPYEKMMEIKLLQEVQLLEEKLVETEERLKAVVVGTQQRREEVVRLSEEPQVTLYLILNSFPTGFSPLQRQKISALQTRTLSLSALSSKTRVLRLRNRQKSHLLQELQQQIAITRQKLHVGRESAVEAMDVADGCLANRSRTIQEMRWETEKAKESFKQWELKIQEEMQAKIKMKLLLEKEIHELTESMQEMRCLGGTVQNTLTW